MLNWPAKDPDEVLDYAVEWSARLETAEFLSSSVFVIIAGTLTIDSQNITATRASVWVSGGTDGTTVEIRNRVTTSGGRTLEETIFLPIVSTSAVAAAVPYTAPNAANLRSRFAPRFDSVTTEQINNSLLRAARYVDESWTEGDFVEGRLLYAAHDLTLNGFGTGAESGAAASGALGFKSIRSGALSLDRGESSGGSAGFGATSYGQRFRDLLRVNKAGPRVVNGYAGSYLGCANDWPI